MADGIEIETLKVYVLCRYAAESSLYHSWLGQLPCSCEVVTSPPADWQPPEDCGIVVAHDHFRWEEVHTLRRIEDQRRIPTLMLADGILEFRNTWENPTIPASSMYRPLLASKIACIGPASAHRIASWGNRGKTEIVGLPRLDPLLNMNSEPRDQSTFKILVATATTPAFTESQWHRVRQSLQSLREYLEGIVEVRGRRLEVEWRLTAGLHSEWGLPAQQPESTTPLWEVIQKSDAVITTPSTIYLESALLNRPTAIIDFTNSPQYLTSGWTITAAEQIPDIVMELAAPSPARLLFQNDVLHDNLYCRSPAAPRMVRLVMTMLETGLHFRNQHKPLSLAEHLLPMADDIADDAVSSGQLFPENTAFQIDEVSRLQAELEQAVSRLGTLPLELAEKNHQITGLQLALDESRRRVAEVRARLFKLRKILGIGKENEGDE